MSEIKNNNTQYTTVQSIKILFQGDSITEAYRVHSCSDDLGKGYVLHLTQMLNTQFSEKHFTFLNRGVGGDKVTDLKNRWQKDCLDLKPDLISILIGINDVVGRYFWSKPTPSANFENDYRILLEQINDNLDAKIVLLTPFMDFKTSNVLTHKIFLKQKINTVKKLSREFNTTLIPLDELFKKVITKSEPNIWSTDGVHPTTKGHRLIAQSWIDTVKLHI